jgi:HSP20 family protein
MMKSLKKEVINMFELVPWRRNRGALARPRRDLFSWFFEDLTLPDFFTAEQEWMPRFDVSETGNEIIVKAELPGMDVKDIDIALTDGLLTIKGERKLEKEDKEENYHRIERQFGSFSRSLNLGARVKADGIEAAYKDGILTVTLPKVEVSKPKKIEVKS